MKAWAAVGWPVWGCCAVSGCFAVWSLLAGCSRPAPSAASASTASAKALAVPTVSPIEPSSSGGAEICFNATDDNSNLLIDEGCDVRQGDVHFMIAWPDAAVDVDLLVTDPSGSLAGVTAPSTLGLVLSDDCPRAGAACNGQAFESVHLDGDEVPPGKYHVRVVVQEGPSARPISVRFGARLPGVGLSRQLDFSPSARQIGFEFSVADEGVVGSLGE